MRADAARRRADLIRAARHLFAQDGGDVALEAVAAAAGVGIATLYRNFESRTVLAEQVGLAILTDLDAVTARAVGALPLDPAPAWRTYLDDLVALDLGALTAALSPEIVGALEGPLRDAQARSLASVEVLLVEARRAGLVPDGLEALEFVVAVGIVTRPQPERIRAAAPHLVGRLIDTLTAGLRAQANTNGP